MIRLRVRVRVLYLSVHAITAHYYDTTITTKKTYPNAGHHVVLKSVFKDVKLFSFLLAFTHFP